MSDSIVVLMSRVMADVGAVKKGDRNDHQKFLFRGIDAVVNAVSPALHRHGVVVVPMLESVERGTSPTARGGAVSNVYVVVRYVFHGPAGDTLETVVAAEAFDSGDKATAKAMSVAFRTALLQALSLPTDEPDPDTETYERSQHQEAPRQSPADAARRALADAAQASGVDLQRVVAAYASHHGTDLRTDDDADRISGFVSELPSLATVETSVDAQAQDGAPA